MTLQRDDPAPSAPCPYLGLRDDPATRYAFPSAGQRCHARRRPAGVTLAKQEADCLTARHRSCPRYHPPAAASPSGGAGGGHGGRWTRGLRVAAGIAVSALLLVLAALVGILLGGALGLAVPR